MWMNSFDRSTLEFSSVPAAMLPRPPVPAFPIVALPEAVVSENRLPPARFIWSAAFTVATAS